MNNTKNKIYEEKSEEQKWVSTEEIRDLMDQLEVLISLDFNYEK